ncbi:hypothetical protein AAY473_031579 [Plecturocebus cupreus]
MSDSRRLIDSWPCPWKQIDCCVERGRFPDKNLGKGTHSHRGFRPENQHPKDPITFQELIWNLQEYSIEEQLVQGDEFITPAAPDVRRKLQKQAIRPGFSLKPWNGTIELRHMTARVNGHSEVTILFGPNIVWHLEFTVERENREIPGRGDTRVASATLLAGAAVLPAPQRGGLPVRSIRDGRARLVPSPQGKRQLEALRTESFTASTANPGGSGSVGNGRPPKEN